MDQTIYAQIEDSEQEYIESSYWQLQPYLDLIREGKTEELMKKLDIRKEAARYDERIDKNERRRIEFMTVSMINALMLAAISGGSFPPEVQRIADLSFKKIADMHDVDDIPEIVRETAFQFCEHVRITKLRATSNLHVEKAKEYIRTHLTQRIDIDDITSSTVVSRYHLSRIFKETVGMTMQEYLMHERIEAAKKLLTDQKYTISKISNLLQFCDQSYFTLCFKRSTGITPSQYRMQNDRHISA